MVEEIDGSGTQVPVALVVKGAARYHATSWSAGSASLYLMGLGTSPCRVC